MSDKTTVDIHAQAAFGQAMLLDVLTHYESGVAAAMSKMSAAEVGMSGTNEAQTFGAWYSQELMGACGSFLKDSRQGIESLSNAAIIEAANYRQGDLSQAQALDDVLKAFNPAAGTPSVATDAAKAEAQARQAQVAQAKASARLGARGRPDQLTGPDGDGIQPDICVAPSPERQADIHRSLYGKDERWHPRDPNAPVDDGSGIPLVPGPEVFRYNW
jgi:hypothetical protein